MNPLPLCLVLLLVATGHAIRVPVWHQAKFAIQRHQRQHPSKELYQPFAPPKQVAVDVILNTKSRPVFVIDERNHVLKRTVPSESYNKPYVIYNDKNNNNKRYNRPNYKAQSAHFRPTAAVQQHGENNVKESKKSRFGDFTYRTNHVNPFKKEMYFGKPTVFETFNEQGAISTGYQEPLFKPQSYASFPINDHEIPFEISSSPYYYNVDGGNWTSPIHSQTDRPYKFHTEEPVRSHIKQEKEVRPEGYAVLENLQNDFIEERKKFSNDLNTFPRNHKINIPTKQEIRFKSHFSDEKLPMSHDNDQKKGESSSKQDEVQEKDGSSEENTEFVPIRLYSQVRETEESEHLPSALAVEPNLKEIVKDSKIHTVYTEEGYEDSAYDHGAHVKNAESEEDYAKFNKESDHPRPVKDIGSIENESDSDLADSSFGAPVIISAKNNKYAKTGQIKTASLKDMGNGNMELEIKSQVKLLDTPNNGKELHKYINIYPRNYALPLVNGTERNNTISLPIFSSVNYTKIINFNTNFTDNSTQQNIMDDIAKHLNRPKRNAESKSLTENLHIINENEFNLANDTPITTTENIRKKYPYYKMNDKQVNVNSPLRYAEDLSQIPVKEEGKMSFYEQADMKKECTEVESQVDPIPNRVKDKDGQIGDEPRSGENFKGDSKEPIFPRLGSLGDKIDCYKSKYFGDNPLDSPIFKEETVGQPSPIFPEFDKVNQDEKYRKIVNIEIKTKQTIGHNVKLSEGVETSTPYAFSILTTTNYGTNNNPKNIYDQIDLINKYSANITTEDAPQRGSLEDRIEKSIGTSNYRMPKVSDIIFDNQNATESQVNSTIISAPSNEDDYYDDLETYNATNTNSSSETLPESLPLIVLRRRRKRPGHLRRAAGHKHDTASNRKRFITKPNKYPLMSVSQFNQIFPTTTFSPKYNVISEVHYKNEIKPNEQLNVFADIINNIKNASMFDNLKPEQPKVEPITVKLNTNIDKNTSRKIKIPTRKIKIRNPDIDQSLSESQNVGLSVKNNYFYKSPAPTVHTKIQSFYPREQSKITKERKSSEQLYEEFMTALKNKDYNDQDQQIDSFFKVKPITFNDYNNRKRRRKPPVVATFYPNDYPVLNEGEQQDEPQQSESEVQESLDLAPIPDHEIYKKKRPLTSYTTIDEKPMNIYFVPGMRPPPSIGKPYVYSDYKLTYPINTLRRRMGYGNHRIRRRSPAEYSDVKRTNLNRRPSTVESSEENDDEDDDDEYVPHRPTKYHYDPETKRIIYEKTQEKESSEEEDDDDDDDSREEEEEEAEEEIIVHKKKKISVESTTKSSKPNTIYHKDVLDMKNGPTLVDFVNLVKANPKYVEIKDPEPTEKSDNTTASVSLHSSATTPAAFLEILNKVRNNSDYKVIKDPEDDKQQKTKSTTAAVEKEENDEEKPAADETEDTKGPKRFQNAPGGQYGPGVFQVFDISEYLPKIKTYNPKTLIDYSKYKTIERSTTVPTTRHYMSSKYSAEDDGGVALNNTKAPAISATLKEEIRKGESEALEVKATTTAEPLIIITPENSTPKLTTTTSRPRVSIRQRKRPTTTQRATTERIREEGTTEHVEKQYTRATHKPPSRIYPRRPTQKIRIRTRTTTESDTNLSSEEVETSTSNPKRVINRRDNASLKVLQEVPSNHKPIYTPISIEIITERDPISIRSLAGQFKFATPRLVTGDKNGTDYKDPKPGEPEPRIMIEREESRKRFVLRRPRVQRLENVENIEIKTEDSVKVEPNFVIIEEDDKSANEISTSAKLVLQDEQNKTSNKNIDTELLDVIGVAVKRIINAEREQENKAQKNHSPKIESRSFHVSSKESEFISNNPEFVTRGYIQPRNIDVEVFKQYDTKMKHGGNYKHVQEAGLSNAVSKYVAPTAYEIEDRPEIKRLSDIVPKPFAFYSDPKLSTTVNQLNIEQQVVEEIPVQELETIDGEIDSKDYDYDDAVKIFFRSGRKLESTTQKIQLKGIIKDPSKRLYFYAPID